MAADATVQYLSRFLDPFNQTIVIVQVHVAINLRMKSSCRAILFKRENVLQSFNNSSFYHGFGSYDYGYFNGIPKPAHQVILCFHY